MTISISVNNEFELLRFFLRSCGFLSTNVDVNDLKRANVDRKNIVCNVKREREGV